jgi:hypothetical protein
MAFQFYSHTKNKMFKTTQKKTLKNQQNWTNIKCDLDIRFSTNQKSHNSNRCIKIGFYSNVSLNFFECNYDRKLTICGQKVHLWWLEIDTTIGNLKITNYICIVWQQIDNLRTKSASLVVRNWHYYRKSENHCTTKVGVFLVWHKAQ